MRFFSPPTTSILHQGNTSLFQRIGLATLSLTLSLCLVSLISLPALAMTPEETISAYETQILSSQFKQDGMQDRLTRLERLIYGAPQSGSIESRLSQIQHSIKLKPVSKPSTTQNPLPYEAQQAFQKNTQPPPLNYPVRPQQRPQSNAATQTHLKPQKNTDATEYPTVTALERRIIGRDFVFQDIETRLDRLEMKEFGYAMPSKALADRVDKLLENHPDAQPHYQSSPATSSALSGLPSTSDAFVGSRDTYVKLDTLERILYNGKTSPNMLITERLDRLEDRVFGYKHSGQSVNTRVNRLLQNYEKQSSSFGYKKKPNQSASGYSSPSAPVAPRAPVAQSATLPPAQNIQIGAGIMSNNQYNFSPELINMLPNRVRQQIGAGHAQAGPPVNVKVNETYTYPGLRTMDGSPLTYQNQYNTRAQTMVLPNPNTTTGSPTSQSTLSGQQPAPMYQGPPEVIQTLAKIESQLYGQINTFNDVATRLMHLEIKLLGSPNLNASDLNRTRTLVNALQMHSVVDVLSPKTPSQEGEQSNDAPPSLKLGIPLN